MKKAEKADGNGLGGGRASVAALHFLLLPSIFPFLFPFFEYSGQHSTDWDI